MASASARTSYAVTSDPRIVIFSGWNHIPDVRLATANTRRRTLEIVVALLFICGRDANLRARRTIATGRNAATRALSGDRANQITRRQSQPNNSIDTVPAIDHSRRSIDTITPNKRTRPAI